MPRMVGRKNAIGTLNVECQGCLGHFRRGQRMTAVSEGREFKGWFCDECIRRFNPPVAGAVIAERPEPLFAGGWETESQ